MTDTKTPPQTHQCKTNTLRIIAPLRTQINSILHFIVNKSLEYNNSSNQYSYIN